MAEYSHLLLSIDARGVASVVLNRPEVHNAFNPVLISELTRVFTALAADDAVRIAVLSGQGKSFCAGGDLQWMRSMKQASQAENAADAQRMAEMYHSLRHFPKPLLAIVQGNALGGGSGLAAVADYVLAAEDAIFGFTETRLGLLPAVIAPYAIEKIGLSAARAYFISGMTFSAARAQAIGLIHQLAAPAALEQERAALITQFLKAAPQASQKAKALIHTLTTLNGNPEAIQAATIAAITQARISDEGQEGMDALLAKRTPVWAQP
jgi:methylglutaconyl-CoA hydratase